MKLSRKLAHSGGNFSNTVSQEAFTNQAQVFYITVMGLSPAITGAVWFAYGIWNAINNPIVGQWTDRTRTRWGRRIPYLRFGAIPLGALFLLVWIPPEASPWLVALWFLGTAFLFDLLFSLLIVAYNALYPELATTARDRSGLSALREAAAVVALLMALALSPILADSFGYATLGMVIGTATAVGYLLASLSGRERPIPADESTPALVESLKVSFRNRAFRTYMAINIAKQFVFAMLVAMLPFYRRFALGIVDEGVTFAGVDLDPGLAEAVLLGLPILTVLPFLGLWRTLTPRHGARRAFLAAFLLFLPGLAVMALARDFGLALAGTMLLAPALAGLMMLPIVLLSDVIDDDQRRTGRQRAGMFFGINGAVNKLAYAVQGVLTGVVLTATGFVAGSTVQSASAVNGVRFLITGTTAIACVAGALLLLRFPLGDPPPSATPTFTPEPEITGAGSPGVAP